MAKGANQKLKLLYIAKILEEETCEKNPITTARLIELLQNYGVEAERKSIYDDIEKLETFGYDIIHVDSRNGGGYYMASREFELAELKLLVDAVQSSRFITPKKSDELIRKLEKLTSRIEASGLQRQVYVAGKVKTFNENILYHIDTIYSAMHENKRISFYYMAYNRKKEQVPRRGGKLYEVSPWYLIWKDENYYLLAYDDDSNMIRHYRVDKMDKVSMVDRERLGQSQYEELDISVYSNRAFGMYSGEEETVVLEYEPSMLDVVIDRFGVDTPVQEAGDKLRSRVKVLLSNQFYGWVVGLGGDAKIVSPPEAVSAYKELLARILREYT